MRRKFEAKPRICAGGIDFRRAFKCQWVPTKCGHFVGDAKQLDDLSIAVTRMEEAIEEAE